MTREPRAVILGGTGLLGSATARRLARAGWQVAVTGRNPEHVPDDLRMAGTQFARAEGYDADALSALVGDHTELLVDCLCRTAADATSLLPLAARARSTVMVSTKAVYVDGAGNHGNSLVAPCFDGPLRESHATVAPSTENPFSREGYAANKVAAEQLLLDSGHPVTVLRVAKAHGRGARRPREWAFVRRILDRRQVLVLANRGSGTDHPVAATNVAALIETVAAQPAARVLNCGDPDPPNGLQIARTVADHLGHSWKEILLEGDPLPPLGAHPWNAADPIVLDMSAATALGYRPAGSYAETVVEELDWLVDKARIHGVDGVIESDEKAFFCRFLDYELEDRHLSDAALRLRARHPPLQRKQP
jgi:nucleoside-diphosphate-sugar epimerase